MEKERYLTPENRISKINSWKMECKKIKSHRPFRIIPKKAALLVLDMQNVFLDEMSHGFIPSSPMIIKPVQDLIQIFADLHQPVIFTRHINDGTDSSVTMRKWWRNAIPETDEKSHLSPWLQDYTKLATKIMQKHYYSAFFHTDLGPYLKEKGISQIIITGVMSHLCCETTARDGFMRNFEPFFVMDGTVSYTEQLHLGSLRAIAHGFGIPISSQELLSQLDS